MSHNEEIHIHTEDHAEAIDDADNGNIFVRIVVIIAIITILLFLAWSIVKFVPKFISSFGTANVSFSSLFNPKDKVSVSTDATEISSENTFTVEWQNNTENKGTPFLSFGCVSGIEVEYNSISGKRPVICNTSFPLPVDKNSYTFFARNTTDKKLTLPIKVTYIDSDMKTEQASGSSSIIITPKGQDNTEESLYNPDYNNNSYNTTNTNKTDTKNTESTQNTKPTEKPQNQTIQKRGTPDLRISLVKIGRTTSSGGFEETQTFYDNDRVTVRFNVANIGTARSDAWTLRANLPTKTEADKLFISQTQPRLNPGDSYELTISFDAFDTSKNTITITLDSNDNNQSNNTLVINVGSKGGGSNNSSSNGRPDLTVNILDIGVMGQNNNQFYYSNNLTVDDKVAVKFEIQNTGDTSTGVWSFKADLPTTDNNNDVFYSGNQSSLAPGEKRVFTLGFDNPEQGTHTIKIVVDDGNNIKEDNENNNTDSESIRVNR